LTAFETFKIFVTKQLRIKTIWERHRLAQRCALVKTVFRSK